jgi:hypothetical protein
MKKKALALIIILSFNFCTYPLWGQVTYTSCPEDLQVVGRNTSTNKGTIVIAGTVNSTGTNYDAIRVQVFRNSVLYSSTTQTLNYTNSIANFNISATIDAELVNYSVNIESKVGNTYTVIRQVNNIVAGDVFIIQGQSNAVAIKRIAADGTDAYSNNFIRTYSGNQTTATALLAEEYWTISDGNNQSTSGAVGAIGQWGQKLAWSLMNSLQIPIAIFNGAHGGAQISFFQRPINYSSSLNSNYGRLYYRLNKTGLKPFVRGVFWSQGESDGSLETPLSTYKSLFTNLKTAWIEDYPNIEHIYMLQTKNGCGGTGLYTIKEAQRQLAYENPQITIMQTDAIAQYTDICHFAFTNGYSIFADRLLPLVQRDLYGISTNVAIDIPMITGAYLSDDTHLHISTDATNLILNSTAENYLLESTTGATITQVVVNGNELIFTLSQFPGTSTISYLGSPAGVGPSGNYVVNSNGLEMVGFYKYPIDTGNDSSTRAIEIIPDNYSSTLAQYTTDLATADGNNTTCGTNPNNNIWFKFIATNNNQSLFILSGGIYGTLLNPVLSLWNSDGSILLGCNTNATSAYLINNNLTIGTTYLISIDNLNSGQTGSFTLFGDNSAIQSFSNTSIIGSLRFNSTTNKFEGWDGTNWVILNM